MKRLIDEQSGDLTSEQHRLTELVRCASLYEPSPFAKRQIHHRITSGRAGARRWSARVALSATVLLGGTAMASVAPRAHRWLSSAPQTEPARSAHRAEVVSPGSPAEPAAASVPSPDVSPTPAHEQRALTALPAAAARPNAPPPVRSRRARPAAQPRAPQADVTSPGATLAPGDDATLVVEAVRALRREHDPRRAQQLLDRYLAQHPSGSLTEDALALAIEAAAVERPADARAYAQRYLAQYPTGRFQKLARRALELGR